MKTVRAFSSHFPGDSGWLQEVHLRETRLLLRCFFQLHRKGSVFSSFTLFFPLVPSRTLSTARQRRERELYETRGARSASNGTVVGIPVLTCLIFYSSQTFSASFIRILFKLTIELFFFGAKSFKMSPA